MKDEGDVANYPSLRPDLKISEQVQSRRKNYVIKDPLKDEYYRFDADEWEIIILFDGKNTLEGMVSKYNHTHRNSEIELETIKEYKDSLDSMDLLQKTRKEHNILLMEKMKEMRKSQLLSKKGSLLYKRFPIIDPDRFFDKIIDKIRFFWTKGFLYFSLSVMIFAVGLIFMNFHEFTDGLYQVFSFSEMSGWNLFFLWITIYTIIAIHEFGHGLTCKHFGGEVHEIGFLLLFFQPCLYCNVNDAWLFDKKWKQVLVTLAGGYIEFFIGALFCIVWWLTNSNTMIHVLSFQVMTIRSVSTVLFNFNPLQVNKTHIKPLQ